MFVVDPRNLSSSKRRRWIGNVLPGKNCEIMEDKNQVKLSYEKAHPMLDACKMTKDIAENTFSVT
jgi:hypothetical protein